MTTEMLERETRYRVAISLARGLLAQDIVTQAEYVRIDTILAEKFSPVWGVLYREST